MKHVFIHNHIVVALDIRKCVCNDRNKKINQHDLQKEGGKHKEQPTYLEIVVSEKVGVEIS